MLISSALLIACPGCSSPQPIITLLHSSHAFYAWVIVIVGLCLVPVLAATKILFIARRRPPPSRARLWSMTIVLTIIFFISGGPTNSFGSALCFWLFMPLNIIMGIMMSLLWYVENILVLIMLLLIIPVYFFLFMKWLYRLDRKFYWRWGKTGQRLLRRQQYRRSA